jgi:hypothetical protein
MPPFIFLKELFLWAEKEQKGRAELSPPLSLPAYRPNELAVLIEHLNPSIPRIVGIDVLFAIDFNPADLSKHIIFITLTANA